MLSIDEIGQLLDAGGDVKEIRSAIADLIEHILSLESKIGYWEKNCLAHAIAVLALDVYSRHQPTTAWLRLCLVDIDMALVPAGERNESYTPKDKQLNALTIKQLLDDISILRADGQFLSKPGHL